MDFHLGGTNESNSDTVNSLVAAEIFPLDEEPSLTRNNSTFEDGDSYVILGHSVEPDIILMTDTLNVICEKITEPSMAEMEETPDALVDEIIVNDGVMSGSFMDDDRYRDLDEKLSISGELPNRDRVDVLVNTCSFPDVDRYIIIREVFKRGREYYK